LPFGDREKGGWELSKGLFEKRKAQSC
jgi:hypothetical protein